MMNRIERALLGVRTALALVSACLAGAALADSGDTTESRVKAAYVYNFAKYIEWPGTAAQDPLRLCLPGNDRLGEAFNALEGRQAQGRAIHVLNGVPLGQLARCQIVFVGQGDAALLAAVIRSAAESPTLVVGDVDGFIDAGGGIGLVVADDRVQFEVNLEALQRAKLRASAQMLKLARNADELRVR